MRTAGEAVAAQHDGPGAKRMRHDEDMGGLVEHGDEDVKEGATNKLYVTRQDEDAISSQGNE